MTKGRGAFQRIHDAITRSSEGFGSVEGGNVRAYVFGRYGKKLISNGPATSYGYLRVVEEELYQNFIGAGKVGTAATMKHTPRIGGLRNTERGSSTSFATRSKSKKKIKYGKSNNAVFNLLVQMERSSTLEGQRLEIDQLWAHISTEETSFLTHKKSYREDRMEVRRLMKDLREKGISEGEMDDDYN